MWISQEIRRALSFTDSKPSIMCLSYESDWGSQVSLKHHPLKECKTHYHERGQWGISLDLLYLADMAKKLNKAENTPSFLGFFLFLLLF